MEVEGHRLRHRLRPSQVQTRVTVVMVSVTGLGVRAVEAALKKSVRTGAVVRLWSGLKSVIGCTVGAAMNAACLRLLQHHNQLREVTPVEMDLQLLAARVVVNGLGHGSRISQSLRATTIFVDVGLEVLVVSFVVVVLMAVLADSAHPKHAAAASTHLRRMCGH